MCVCVVVCDKVIAIVISMLVLLPAVVVRCCWKQANILDQVLWMGEYICEMINNTNKNFLKFVSLTLSFSLSASFVLSMNK